METRNAVPASDKIRAGEWIGGAALALCPR